MFTIQCDFDDTITLSNVTQALLQAFASEEWRDINARYTAGQISVEESNRKQFALLKASKRDIQDFVSRTVVVRPGFPQFVDYCRAVGIGLTIVSCGLDLYIEPTLRKLGILNLERYSGRGRVLKDGIVVDYVDPHGVARKEGFKLACLEYLRERGRPIIYIGDGRSDTSPAVRADYVIARDELEEHFCSMSLPHFTFDTFYDVRQIVEDYIVGQEIPMAQCPP